MGKRNDPVNHPTHYTDSFDTLPVECIDLTQYQTFCAGNVTKYLFRCGQKDIGDNGYQDFKKAIWYFKQHNKLPIKYHFTGNESVAQAIFSTKFPEPDREKDPIKFMRWRLIDFCIGEDIFRNNISDKPMHWYHLMIDSFINFHREMTARGLWPQEELWSEEPSHV